MPGPDGARRVLMIAYYFPPLGGAGVQRTLKFVKYLPQAGWQPVILSARQIPNGPRDPGLLAEIPPAVPRYTAPALLLHPRLPWRLRNLVTKWLLLVDEYIGWLPFAVRQGLEVIRAEAPDAIYSTSAPYTDHLVARALARKTGLPWVADFRDPWVGNFSHTFATPWHEKLARRLERQVVAAADAVVVVSEPMQTALQARIPSLPPAKIQVIPNGFDRSDFAGLAPAARPADAMLVVYTGSFYGRQQTPESFLRAVRLALDSGSLPPEKIRLRFVGNTGRDLPRLAEELGLGGILEICGYLPHSASLAHLLAADLLLLIIGGGPGSEAVFTGKIFEYLAAGKPILCLAEPGSAAGLVTAAKAGVVARPDQPAEIAAALARFYQDWQAGRRQAMDAAVVARFDRRRQAGQLAEILTRIAPEGKP